MTLDFLVVWLVVNSMASLPKKRAVGVGENPDDRENESSSEGSQNDSDSGEEDSNDSDEEINEVGFL